MWITYRCRCKWNIQFYSMDKATLIGRLPVFRGNYQLIKDSQTVGDIIKEIERAHKLFAQDYDKIAFEFYYPDPLKTLKGLWGFCKVNIKYRQESEREQTTMSPGGILALSRGDCKHYALFIGGVLDALNRAGESFDWWYRFAGYGQRDVPGHVFIVARVGSREYWIDPVLNSFDQRLIPELFIDKKIEVMPLYRVSGVEEINSLGIASLTVTPFTGDNLNFDGSHKFANVFSPYLGLSAYRDYGGDRDINESAVAAALNAEIARGPNPGHTVPPDFVKWVYDSNIRSWNFYYPGGVKPGFTAESILPAGYPRWVITQDGRLTFDQDIKVDDYRNPEIHLMTAWGQAIINQFDPTPYPLKPQAVKEFSQLLYGNVNERNLFTERRGDSFVKETLKALEDTVNFVKQGVLMVVGFVPRNAFLGLVGINAFNFASNLWDKINLGQWDAIAKRWKALGGIPDKLLNTIKDGKDKPAILGAALGAEPVTTSTAALLAAAAPIIAALLMFLDKDGKAKEILSTTKTFLQTQYPLVDWSGFDFLDQPGGIPLSWEADPRYNENLPGVYNPGTLPGSGPLAYLQNNPLLAAGIGAGATYFILRKQPGNKKIVIPLLVGAGIYLLLSKSGTSKDQQIAAIMQWTVSTGSTPESRAAFQQLLYSMTDSEVNTIYSVVTQYLSKGIALPQTSPLYLQFSAIGTKYNIFT
jgi:hypothetical protein